MEGADYAAVNPAKLSTVEINRTTTHSKVCASELAASGSEYSALCKLFHTVAESVFSRGNHKTMASLLYGFDIIYFPTSFFMPFLISEFPSR